MTVNENFFLLYGSTGYIGTSLSKLLDSKRLSYVKAKARLENSKEIEEELDKVRPSHVLLSAGLTGRPNIDWCEEHRIETIQVNVLGTLFLIDQCYRRNIHVTYYGTGCIYNDYNEENRSFCERDPPNWTESFYSKTKLQLEFLVSQYPNALILRIRMPVTSDFNERNFIYKISKYEKLVNYSNSISILDDLLPISIAMTVDGCRGIYNFTNPGSITHNELMELYKKYINPDKKIHNFDLQEQSKILKVGRCNCILDTTKIETMYEIPSVQESIKAVFEKMSILKENTDKT